MSTLICTYVCVRVCARSLLQLGESSPPRENLIMLGLASFVMVGSPDVVHSNCTWLFDWVCVGVGGGSNLPVPVKRDVSRQ